MTDMTTNAPRDDYLAQAENLLHNIELACDRLNDSTDLDIDNQRVGNMLTLTFGNGSQIVINLQKPLQEVWLASLGGGFHFKLQAKQWFDTKGQGDFYQILNAQTQLQTGQVVRFDTPTGV